MRSRSCTARYSFVHSQRHPQNCKQTKKMEPTYSSIIFIWICTWTVLSVPNVLLKKKFCETKRKLYAVVVTTLDHTMCTIFFFPFVVFSTHCTVHIKNWDTPKKLFVKWLFVRHIQCQGTTCGVVQYNSWANSFYIQFAQLGFVGSFFLLSGFIMQDWKIYWNQIYLCLFSSRIESSKSPFFFSSNLFSNFADFLYFFIFNNFKLLSVIFFNL